MHERSIPSHFVRSALRGAQHQGHDCTAILRQAGMQSALPGEPRARLEPEHFARLIKLRWELLGDEYMGFRPVPSKPGTFARRHRASTHCRTLGKALHRGILFYNLFPQAPALRLLGFSEPSTFFHRAFKTWTGLTPDAYRAQEN